MNNYKLIGISGLARSGKDTFTAIAQTTLNYHNKKTLKFALADKLKEEVNKILKECGFSFNVYTNNNKEKEIIRPLLVWWGCARRIQNPKYWINSLHNQMQETAKVMTGTPIFFVSDIRFQNELDWIHDNGGLVIHIQKWNRILTDNGVFMEKCEPPNKEEAENDPIVRRYSDIAIDWEHEELSGSDAVNCKPLISKVNETLHNEKLKNYLMF